MTPEVLYQKLGNIKVSNPLCAYTIERCRRLAPLIEEINTLKREKNALILAHSYVHPDIIYGVADHVGDSFGLSQKALQADESTIVFPAVRFMAETAKILNPAKTVIDPNPTGGCSLADAIDAEKVHELRIRYPEHTFVCYINTTAAVKALCDVCVTSSNALRILAAIPNDKIYFLPDRLMAQNLRDDLRKQGIYKEILFYKGSCYVHEEFEGVDVEALRLFHPNVTVLAHPECDPSVVAQADHVASTTGIFDYVSSHVHLGNPFVILTECGVASRLQVEIPEAEIIGACMLCKYMKSNSLESIRDALLAPKPEQIIEIPAEVQEGALRTLKAMFDLSI